MSTLAPEFVLDIFLGPGDFYFGDRETRIRTLLGSCVAITLWHPEEMIGGMCHFVVPTRPVPAPDAPLDGRYADEAIAMFLHEVAAAGTRPQNYEVKMFGGGKQFAAGHPAAGMAVSDRNVQEGKLLLERHNLSLSAMHLGGHGHRQVMLDLWSGVVWLKHVDTSGDK